MRRLPIYLLIDTSGRMHGDRIGAINLGLKEFRSELRSDPRAIEGTVVSLITFDSRARQVVPLTDVQRFDPPVLKSSGSRAFGEALGLLETCVRLEALAPSSDYLKPDKSPRVLVMLVGEPSDNWQPSADRIKTMAGWEIVACATDLNVDESTLQRLTDSVVRLEEVSAPKVCNLFRFVHKVFHKIDTLTADHEKSRFVWKNVPLPQGVAPLHPKS
jgi:uncharacterized protein YegL